jgi:CBS domain-containing protein
MKPFFTVNVISLAKVKDIMIKEVITIDEGESVAKACEIMGERHIGSLIVTSQGTPIGIFTERDLLSKIIPKRFKLDEIKVKDHMSTPLTVISPEFDLKEAARIMSQLKIRRLPVIEGEKLVGILTSADIIRALAKAPLEF